MTATRSLRMLLYVTSNARSSPTAEALLLGATGRSTVDEALLWIAEDHPISRDSDWSELLQAIVELLGSDETSDRALRRVVRGATVSEVDTSRILFDPDELPAPADFKLALSNLLSYSPGGTLSGLTPRSLVRAQYANPLSIPVLCLAAGVAYNDACQWFNSGSSTWKESDTAHLLKYLGELVSGGVVTPIPGSVPARGIEFFDNGGWPVTEQFISDGVPFEILLAQRSGGSVWGLHKNKTSSVLNRATAEALVKLLTTRGIGFLRATTIGGDSRQTDLQELTGLHDKRVNLVIVSDGQPAFLIGFSSAKDGGTARANGDGLMSIPLAPLPMAFVLTGLGWAGRTETDRLARRFDGMLFTEKSLNQLVDRIEIELP